LLVKRVEQIVGDAYGAKSSYQYRRSVANPRHGVGHGLHLLVDHVFKTPSLSFGLRGLRRVEATRK
jgi:hypothetical protein